MAMMEKLVGKRYKRAIGTIEVHGEIVPYAWRPVGIYTVAADVRAALDAMAKDSGVRAAIVDVSSPGGAIVASREIARAIESFPKPAVAWIRDYGASGAYEVAAACRRIVAELLGKVGVRAELMKAGRLKDLFSWIDRKSRRRPSPEHRPPRASTACSPTCCARTPRPASPGPAAGHDRPFAAGR